ncbi:hypothetical protein GJ496_002153 [Pomphorhynchus laevis]|nr:hypothetical protein GJ496_002153 [Pomphorhynchus laevis]
MNPNSRYQLTKKLRDKSIKFPDEDLIGRYGQKLKPEYAGSSEEEQNSEDEYEEITETPGLTEELIIEQPLNEDRRLRRILFRDTNEEKEEKLRRHCERDKHDELFKPLPEAAKQDDDVEAAELSDEEISRRRAYLRAKIGHIDEEPELLARENDELIDEDLAYTTDEEASGESENSDEDDDTTEFGGKNFPRLRPVFVKRQDRATIAEREAENARLEKEQSQARRRAEEQRRQTLKMLEEVIRREQAEESNREHRTLEAMINAGGDINTDDEENDVVEYEKWKLRELKRLKRDQEQLLDKERERQEAERNRLLADTGRTEELRNKQRYVVNKEIKGKYKFLQKYYHRGAFYLHKEDSVFTRDFSAPTLEDHFDKTILPKVMQVKNFGMAGRTKYTHLVDQDTTCFESPWAMDKVQVLRFHNARGGGMKQCFDNPSSQKRKA